MAGKSLASLDAHARDMAEASIAWMDRFWDEKAGLLLGGADVFDPQNLVLGDRHGVRNSAWYALGLLIRDAPGDRERAAYALDAIMDNQLDAPGAPFHGTFLHAPEEAHPTPTAVEWRDYDPNWREFIYTTIAIILDEYEDRLPPALVQRIDAGLPKAVAGALDRGLKASYTNIALMNAFMLWFAGDRLGNAAWVSAGEGMARAVYDLFKVNDTFDEYNSPTYYGPDLYALAQWRAYAGSSVLQELGTEMEAQLWRDIARFYHAGLRNMAGPYDRAYGMDMTRYAAVTGEWIWLVTGRQQAAFPDLERPFAHAHDFCFAPLAAILGAPVPSEARPHFFAFQGERQVERVISESPRRVATAWLSDGVMLGAEDSARIKDTSVQFHPATMHWRCGRGEVGWMRLLHSEPVEVRASANRLQISGRGEKVFHIHAPGLTPPQITPTRWQLPHLTVAVQGNVPAISVHQMTDLLQVRYEARDDQMVDMTLTTTLDAPGDN